MDVRCDKCQAGGTVLFGAPPAAAPRPPAAVPNPGATVLFGTMAAPGANVNRQLQRAAPLKPDQGQAAFIEGTDLATREDGGPKAVERLKAALATAPQSARIHFRLAMAYQALHQDAARVKVKRRPPMRVAATASRNTAAAYAPAPTSSSSTPATRWPTGPAQFACARAP